MEEMVPNVADQTEKIKEVNISLIIDEYEDIFSSFDPRSYLSRSLSDDFLHECRRAAREKEDGLELRILVPKDKRNIKNEWKIKKRLKSHFAHHVEIEEKKFNSIKREGWFWMFWGIAINVLIVYGILNFKSNLIHVILSLFEIPSWFLMWEGMRKVLMDSIEVKPEYDFYKKVSKAEINFIEY